MQGIEREMALPCNLHGRAANYVVSEVNALRSNVLIIKDDRSVKMTSLLGVLSLGCVCGDTVTIACMNEDKETAERDFKRVEKILTEAC